MKKGKDHPTMRAAERIDSLLIDLENDGFSENHIEAAMLCVLGVRFENKGGVVLATKKFKDWAEMWKKARTI